MGDFHPHPVTADHHVTWYTPKEGKDNFNTRFLYICRVATTAPLPFMSHPIGKSNLESNVTEHSNMPACGHTQPYASTYWDQSQCQTAIFRFITVATNLKIITIVCHYDGITGSPETLMYEIHLPLTDIGPYNNNLYGSIPNPCFTP